MKKIFITICIGICFTIESYACVGSNCKECPDGFFYTIKCCKDTNIGDCVFIKDDFEKCGKDRLKDYQSREYDCCNPDLTKCTGYVNACPECAESTTESKRKRPLRR